MMNTKRILIAAAAGLLAGLSTSAIAQRDPAYQNAREQGQIGEQPDGYLGIVGAPTPALRALVNNINIQRKAKYTEAAASGATVEEFAFTSGCNLILKTQPGEKYLTTGGVWKTRTAACARTRSTLRLTVMWCAIAAQAMRTAGALIP